MSFVLSFYKLYITFFYHKIYKHVKLLNLFFSILKIFIIILIIILTEVSYIILVVIFSLLKCDIFDINIEKNFFISFKTYYFDNRHVAINSQYYSACVIISENNILTYKNIIY